MSIKSKITLLVFLFSFLPISVHAGTIVRPVMNSGLVGYWDFQEGAGDMAYDKSGNRNHGMLENGPSWTDGQIGGGLDFDGSDDYVLSSGQVIPSTSDFTLSGWLETTQLSSDSTIFAAGEYNEDDMILYGATTNGSAVDEIRLFHRNDTEVLVGPDIRNTGWRHITLTREDNTFTLFVDGSFSVDGTSSVLIGEDFYIGAAPRGDDSRFFINSILDEVRIYNRALSEGEIERLYKLTRPKVKAPTRDGLVGYWPMEEGSGTQVGDMSGNGNHGQMQNMDPATDWVDGKYGKALDFDGSDDYIALTNELTIDDGRSLSFWAKRGGKSTLDLVGGKIDGDNYVGFGGGNFVPKDGIRVQDDNSSNTTWTISEADDVSIWHHWSLVWNNSGEIELYVDGVFQSSKTGGTLYFSAIGQGYANNNHAFNGQIDEVRIYNRALSESEIETLYESGQAKLNSSQTNRLSDDLVGMWSFDGPDISGTTAYDRSGHDNHGTLLGGPQKTIGKVGQALSFDGADDHLDLGSVYDGVKSVSIYVKPEDTGGGGYFQGKLDEVRFYDRELSHNEVARLYRMQGGAGSDVTTDTLSTNILSLNDTAAINIVDGVVSAAGFTDPTIYIDGQVGSDIDSKWRHIVVTTGTGLNASAVQTATASAFACGNTLSYEGYSYETVEIGDQCWFAEDLRYDDGCSSNTWDDSEPYNACDTQGDGYDGLLYQWGAAMDGSTEEGVQGLCPDGWHIPTDEEFKTLEGTVDSTYGVGDSEWDTTEWRGDDAGDNLKDEDEDWYDGTPGWVTGWNALPGGYRRTSGSLSLVGSIGFWWSSSVDSGDVWRRYLLSSNSRVYRWISSQAYGFSIRCLRD